MSLAQFGVHAASHPEIDVELDRRLEERARSGGCVIESRLAGWLVTRAGLTAVRTWVDCDELVRAGRVAVRDGTTPEVAVAENRERAHIEHERYRSVYGIDLSDRSTYDLVLDSTSTAPDGLAEAIIEAARSTFG